MIASLASSVVFSCLGCATPPADAKEFEGVFFLDDPKPITHYLTATYGGAGPHP